MEEIIEMLAHIDTCVSGVAVCAVVIMVMSILIAVHSFFK